MRIPDTNVLRNGLCYGWILCIATCQICCGREDPSSVAPLIAKIKKGDYQSRLDAFKSLIDLGKRAKPAIPALIELLERDKDSRIRSCAADTLAAIGPDAKNTIPLLVRLLKDDKDRDVRAACTAALGGIGPDAKEAIPVLVSKLKDDKDPAVRYSCAEAIAAIGVKEKDIIPSLRMAIADADKGVRGIAAKALAKFDPNSEEAISTLAKLLKDEDSGVRSSAADTLGSLDCIESTKIKIAIPALVAALKDPEVIVRECVAQSLGWICVEPETVVPALIERVNDVKDSRPRVYAIQALREYGPDAKAAIPALTRALKDSDSFVRGSAEQALKSIKTWKKKRGRKGMKEQDDAFRKARGTKKGTTGTKKGEPKRGQRELAR